MNVFAVISEYNPFHNGHAYMLTQLRKAGATHIVAIMGGPFCSAENLHFFQSSCVRAVRF